MAESPRLRERLAAGQPVFGCFLRYPDAGLAELLALQDFDVVVFDGEHGALTPQACEHLARAVELRGVAAGVRVEANRTSSILRYLDAGATVCHVPGIESATDAERAVRAAKYRPEGDRGLAASRASRYGVGIDYAEYVSQANSRVHVVLHIESKAGVDAVEAIARVEGVDVLLVGALDLSHDLGFPGRLDHPAIQEATELIADAARRGGKALGAVVGSGREAQLACDRGAYYVMTTTEAMITPSSQQYLGIARGCSEAERSTSARSR